MNVLDLLALALVSIALILGWRSGALPQLLGLAGAVLGVFVAFQGILFGRDWLDTLGSAMRLVVILVVLFLGMAFGETLGSGFGANLRQRLGRGAMDALDRTGGAFLGAGQALIMIWLLGGLLLASGTPNLAREARRSVALTTLSGVLPPPATVSSDIRQLLDASGLPDLFIGLEPAPEPPVPAPGQPRANAIAAPAEASTVQVDAEACGYTISGTGFAIAPNYVVTNAHVVAGETSVAVRSRTGVYDARPVLFDSDLDIALLYARHLDVPALQFAASTPSRGTEAAALGHPGGGPLTVIPAAVAGSYSADGRNLYGNGIVTRQIIELRAGIRRGDSGGPLVLADGSVGGVIFAASQANSNVGYALAPGPVADEVTPAVGRTAQVDVGPCIQ